MSSNYGYDVYIDGLILPITPGEITSEFDSNNETVTLINEGEINILKSPSLAKISFDARFPMREYPYSRMPLSFVEYFDRFTALKENKKPFQFIISRRALKGARTWDTNMEMALEDFEVKESADEGDDVIVSFTLKQYKHYGVKLLSTNPRQQNSNRNDSNNPSATSSTYKVQSGDCLWNIAKAAYGDGSMWTLIYEANKDTIEAAAQAHGKDSSSNGHWIYPDTQLVIPGADTTDLDVQKLTGSSNTKRPKPKEPKPKEVVSNTTTLTEVDWKTQIEKELGNQTEPTSRLEQFDQWAAVRGGNYSNIWADGALEGLLDT